MIMGKRFAVQFVKKSTRINAHMWKQLCGAMGMNGKFPKHAAKIVIALKKEAVLGASATIN